MSTDTLTPAQVAEIRTLIESAGFLPMTNKAARLFASAARNHLDPAELARLRKMFDDAGYLPRSKALRLLEFATGT